jgi:hypothetical protein
MAGRFVWYLIWLLIWQVRTSQYGRSFCMVPNMAPDMASPHFLIWQVRGRKQVLDLLVSNFGVEQLSQDEGHGFTPILLATRLGLADMVRHWLVD